MRIVNWYVPSSPSWLAKPALEKPVNVVALIACLNWLFMAKAVCASRRRRPLPTFLKLADPFFKNIHTKVGGKSFPPFSSELRFNLKFVAVFYVMGKSSLGLSCSFCVNSVTFLLTFASYTLFYGVATGRNNNCDSKPINYLTFS